MITWDKEMYDSDGWYDPKPKPILVVPPGVKRIQVWDPITEKWSKPFDVEEGQRIYGYSICQQVP